MGDWTRVGRSIFYKRSDGVTIETEDSGIQWEWDESEMALPPEQRKDVNRLLAKVNQIRGAANG